MPWQPTTDEVRGAWKALVGTTKSFDAWLDSVKAEERERAIQIFDKATFHYGKTHSARTECKTCDIFLTIQGETK